MPHRITRRAFQAAAVPAALATPAAAADPKERKPMDPGPTPPADRDYPAPKFTPSFKKPQLGRTLIQDFVIFAHYDLDMVKSLLAKEPALVNATVDWGGGDWESALGGAAHTGQRAIAEFLLGKGARIDLFAAAMLGMLDVVKGILAAYPGLVDARGPHGIPLLMHAKMGGKAAEPVFDYLQSLKPTTPPKTP